MRREWTAMLREQDWDGLESLAKSSPSQQLADSFAEWVRGLPDQADRRRLKRLIYLLSKQGFDPQEPEEAEQDPSPSADSGFSAGLLSTADSRGATAAAIGVQRGEKVRWLAAIFDGSGILSAEESECAPEDADRHLEKLRSAFEEASPSAACDADYLRWRLAQTLRAMGDRPAPSRLAYWRAWLLDAEHVPHPSESISHETSPEEEVRALIFEGPGAGLRLELGLVTPVVAQLHKAETEDDALSDEKKKKRAESILAKARSELFGTELIARHSLLLRDLGYVLHERGESRWEAALSAAKDLEDAGPESEYAKALLAKTVFLLVESWRRRASEERLAASEIE